MGFSEFEKTSLSDLHILRDKLFSILYVISFPNLKNEESCFKDKCLQSLLKLPIGFVSDIVQL